MLKGKDDEARRRIGVSEPKELGELRAEKGLSVEELAEQSGVDADIIRAIERGRWYQESEGFVVNREEGEVTHRLTKALGAEEAGILMDTPPKLQPGDIVLGAEASGLLTQEVIEANADKIGIAVPDPETGEVGLIWYESLTQEDIDKVLADRSRKQEVVDAQGERLLDYLARMQEAGLQSGESWFDYVKRREQEDG